MKAKDSNYKNEYREQYKDLQNSIVIIIVILGKAVIKQIININDKRSTMPSLLIVNKKSITNPLDIANSFNQYFSTTAEKLGSKLYHVDQDFSKYLTVPDANNLFIKPVYK